MSLHILIPLTTETLTSFRTTKIEFKLGEEFDECTADGRDCKTLASLDAEKRQLVKVRALKSVTLQSTESNFGVTLQRRRRRGGTCVSGGEHSCVKKQWIFNK